MNKLEKIEPTEKNFKKRVEIKVTLLSLKKYLIIIDKSYNKLNNTFIQIKKMNNNDIDESDIKEFEDTLKNINKKIEEMKNIYDYLENKTDEQEEFFDEFEVYQ